LINAEVLAGITIIQTLYPGASVLYGSVASVFDMKTAVLALGAPERGLINSLCTDLAQRYGIPSVMGGLSTDAKQLDEQAGFEKALTVWPLVGKANLVFGMGVMDSANTYSFEQLVLDNEMIGAIKRACYGVEAALREEEISLIIKIGWGGEYLSAPHTLKNFRENWFPQLMTRTSFENWEKENKPLLIRIREAITNILNRNAHCFTSPEVDQNIRKLLMKNGVKLPIDL
jgi:trimethylamine--corrinoid protein Co-methyltransferase